MPQHAHRLTLVHNLFGELLACRVDSYGVMLSQPDDVARFRFDVIVTATIAGAFFAVVGIFGGHHAVSDLIDVDNKGVMLSHRITLRDL